jgi:lipopolysaccharide/colanic/teichoic acid biosynthesis glycosyltransferase
MFENFYRRRGKRLLDLLIAGPLALASLPVQAVVAALIRSRLGRPVLFRQQRPGLDGEEFRLVKFRTMREPAADVGHSGDDVARLTRLGAVLRATSLDELPTLYNVLKGDMSLVGPRPLLPRYLPRYTPSQRRRHTVRPGVTGLAQVSGRNALSWEERFAKDLEYVDQRSLRLDLRIMRATLVKVLQKDGITDGQTVTMTEFYGQEGACGA